MQYPIGIRPLYRVRRKSYKFVAIILIGFNVGVFVEPFIISFLAGIMGNHTSNVAAAAYTTIPLLGVILLIIAVITFFTNRKRLA